MKLRKIARLIINRYYPDILYKKVSYSQDGEDMVLASFFEGQKDFKDSFYIDVGAHHPFRFSNTAYFYKKGWRGINIEPTPTLIKAFNRYRKRDINLNIGVSNINKPLTFYLFNEPALNTFDEDVAKGYESNTRYKLIDKIEVKTMKLSDILEQYKSKIPSQIGFINIDVEGLDMEVLSSNNWEKFRPKFVFAEDKDAKIDSIKDNDIYQFLTKVEYEMVGRTKRTMVFKSLK